MFHITVIFCVKLVCNNKYFASTVDADSLVLKHEGIISYSDDYAPMHFQLFMG